ncbi:thioredoxin domain-containing protein [bacterium]|nr:thioredoxin domain-containing protein [bacterium]
MKKTFVTIILCLSLLGMALSSWLTYQHFQITKKGFEEKSFCSINEYINCDAVNASSYAEIFNTPVSIFAFLYYLLMVFYALGAYWNNSQEKSAGLSFSLLPSLASVAFSAYMAYISFSVLQMLCLFCTGLYVINLLILILTPRALGISYAAIPSFIWNGILKKSKVLTQIPIALAVMVLGGLVFSNISPTAEKDKNFNATQFLDFYFKQPQSQIDTTGRPFWGNPNAKVKIVEFSDFQCPFCRLAAINLKPFLTEYKKDIAIYFFNYPLDNSCNPNMQRPMHQFACAAAFGGVCANQSNKFWEYHDLVFANQKSLNPQKPTEFAKSIGIDEKAFNECVASDSTKNAITLDLEAASKLDISGTPTVFINGRKFGPWRNIKALRTAIAEEIKRAK